MDPNQQQTTPNPAGTHPASPSRAPAEQGGPEAETGTRAAADFDPQELEQKVIEALRTCYDPEIPVNIYDIGLIYDIQIDPNRKVAIKMTLTSPMCPVAESLPAEAQHKVAAVEEVASARVEVVWEPPWNPEMMGEAAKLQLGLI